MVDIVLANSDLTVLGGPSEISVKLDIGPAGARGSQIYTGDGRPNDPNNILNFTPLINDLYINLKASDFEYLFLYQYVAIAGVGTWQKVLRLVPNTALYNPLITFVNGQAVYTVAGFQIPLLLYPIATFFSTELLGDLTHLDFNIQYDILGDKPISSGLNISPIVTEYSYQGISIPLGGPHLPITLSAAEYDIATNTWAPLNGQYYVHTLVTIGGKE